MAAMQLSVTGPWGSEVIPNDLSATDAALAAELFAALMSGEVEPGAFLAMRYGLWLSGDHQAAFAMLVERARRNADHAEVGEDPDRYSLRTFLAERIDREVGRTLAARDAYAAYALWAMSGPRPSRPAERSRFYGAMSAHFMRVKLSDGLHFRDAALRRDADDVPDGASDATTSEHA